MKTLFQIILVSLISFTGFTQEKHIETESVAIEDLISFMVENYSINADSIPQRKITFLLETYADGYNIEDKVILKQAFRLLSKRLTAQDTISIVAYSKFNGIILDKTEATNAKKLLYAIENPISSINYLEKDGIGLAYNLAKKNFTEVAENSVVMIRVPNNQTELTEKKATTEIEANNVKQNKSSAVVLTAIALLPEIIKVIKD